MTLRYTHLTIRELEADLASLESALEAKRGPVSPWRPIDTAPRDGTKILLCRYALLTDVSDLPVDAKAAGWAERLFDPNAPKVWHCCWVSGGFWSSKWDNWNDGVEPCGLRQPTHWMPLPPAPIQQDRDAMGGGDER